MNAITIKINGVEYNLKAEESNEYLQKVASYVDKKMEELMENNNKLSVSASAVLTALNSVDEMFKMQNKYDNIENEISNIQRTDSNLKEQIQYLKNQIDFLNEHNKELKEKLNSNHDHEETVKKAQIIDNLKDQISILEESAKSYMDDKNKYKSENKELKFQLNSAKYKIMELENKLIENQINLAKAKKQMDIIKIKK